MDITAELMLGFFGITASIAAAQTICVVHGNRIRERESASDRAFKIAQLELLRSKEQQDAEINAHSCKAEADALRFMSQEIRKALETQKSAQVVVQR